jgi:hypothetical protein
MEATSTRRVFTCTSKALAGHVPTYQEERQKLASKQSSERGSLERRLGEVNREIIKRVVDQMATGIGDKVLLGRRHLRHAHADHEQQRDRGRLAALKANRRESRRETRSYWPTFRSSSSKLGWSVPVPLKLTSIHANVLYCRQLCDKYCISGGKSCCGSSF